MKSFVAWSLAIALTLTAVVYQRMTGPTNPKRVSVEMGSQVLDMEFPRSLETKVPFNSFTNDGMFSSLEVALPKEASGMDMYILWKRFPGNDSLSRIDAVCKDGVCSFEIPSQPPAGKIAYYPVLRFNGDEYRVGQAVTLRFKAPVSAITLIPHILLMFIAMLFSNYVGIAALLRINNASFFALVTLVALFAGGLVLGPLVQKAAFGEYWTGWPFGGDLTDTKTLFAFLIWFAAWFANRKRNRRYLYVLASVVMLLVYTIPHSTAGSEFDYEQGIVVTGN